MQTAEKVRRDLAESIATDDQEEVTQVTISYIAREFHISKTALKRNLLKRNVHAELVVDEYFSSHSNAFIHMETLHLVAWQIEIAIDLAGEIRWRSDHRPSAVKVTKVA